MLKLQQYKCHKIVGAAIIQDIATSDDGTTYTLDLGMYGTLERDHSWMTRTKAQPGWYLVIYPDEFVSASPPETFEQGYRCLSPEEQGERDERQQSLQLEVLKLTAQ